MAKKNMVTRTIQTTVASILCLDIEKAKPFTKDIVLPRTYKDDEAVLKKAKKMIDTDTVKAVNVSAVKVESSLYGMEEADFIAAAKLLPPRKTEDAVAEG